jgi:hypothetical protein
MTWQWVGFGHMSDERRRIGYFWIVVELLGLIGLGSTFYSRMFTRDIDWQRSGPLVAVYLQLTLCT